jgi:hypothetical protein
MTVTLIDSICCRPAVGQKSKPCPSRPPDDSAPIRIAKPPHQYSKIAAAQTGNP